MMVNIRGIKIRATMHCYWDNGELRVWYLVGGDDNFREGWIDGSVAECFLYIMRT